MWDTNGVSQEQNILEVSEETMSEAKITIS